MICLIKAGKAKGDVKKLEKASEENIAFMNKLGPALNECNPANNITTWQEQPCNGPCNFEWEGKYEPVPLSVSSLTYTQ